VRHQEIGKCDDPAACTDDGAGSIAFDILCIADEAVEVKVEVEMPTSSSNSLWLKVSDDSSNTVVSGWYGDAEADWQWLSKTVSLKAGRNTVALYKRESNVKVKTFKLPAPGACNFDFPVISPSNRWIASDLRP